MSLFKMEVVAKLGKKLDKLVKEDAADHSTVLDLLKTLRDTPVTLEILQKTKIGMTVNSLRKASINEEVIAISKALIKKWKKNINSGDEKEKTSSSTSAPEKRAADSPAARKDDSPPALSTPTSAPTQISFPSRASDTVDSIRLKCREMLTAALKSGDIPDGSGEAGELGAMIEDAIFDEFGNTDMKYKNRVRSRISNLKDSKNPDLRENILLGHVTCSKLAVMTAEEMASDEMKKLRAELTKEAINDHQMAKTGGTSTDLLKCGKCGKRRVTYNQVQTRSADEPMTTFCFCNDCGNRWKFC